MLSGYEYIIETVLSTFNNICWTWEYGRSSTGYGNVKVGKSVKLPHKVAYEIRYGIVSVDLELDHTCRNRLCWNPEHLEPVTHAENHKRGLCYLAGATYQRNKTHCPRGHEYSLENTYFYSKGRVCKTCSRMHKKDYKTKTAGST